MNQTAENYNACELPAGTSSGLGESLYRELIHYGILAPSPENNQPWKCVLRADGFALHLDPVQLGYFFDPQHIASLISCGAFMENVLTLARAMGLRAEVVRTSRSDQLLIEFCFMGKVRDPDAHAARRALQARHTDRRLYAPGKKVPHQTLRSIELSLGLGADYRMHVYDEVKARAAMSDIVTECEVLRWGNRQSHRNTYKLFRFGRTAIERRDGIADFTMGIERILIAPMRLLGSWRLARTLNMFGLAHLMAWRSGRLPMLFSSQVVSIVHQGAPDYVDFGAVIERFWLLANEAGLALQPQGSLQLFVEKVRLCHSHDMSPAQMQRLAALHEKFASITPGYVTGSSQIVMIFRLGYRSTTAPHSLRRDLSSFLATEPPQSPAPNRTCEEGHECRF